MPYIKQCDRLCYNKEVSILADRIKVIGKGSEAGHINYVITLLLKLTYGNNLNYSKHNEIMGALECCKQEWYRHIVGPYEDKKILKNGEVCEYRNDALEISPLSDEEKEDAPD